MIPSPITPYWDIYTRQIRLASKGWPKLARALVVQASKYHRDDIDYGIGYDIESIIDFDIKIHIISMISKMISTMII